MRHLLILCLLLSSFSFIQAQSAMPVKWTFSADKISTNEYELVMTAQVDKGWYVYSQYLESDEGPIPTSFTYENEKDFELIGKNEEVGDKKTAFDELFEMKISKFGGEVKFKQKVKIKKGVNTISGYVEFMTCDNERCLPPTDVPFNIELK